MLTVQLGQQTLAVEADTAVANADIAKHTVLDDARHQSGSAAALIGAQEPVHGLVRLGCQSQDQFGRSLPVHHKAIHHGAGHGLAHFVAIGQAAHTVGHHGQDALGLVERLGGYSQAVLLALPVAQLVELAHLDLDGIRGDLLCRLLSGGTALAASAAQGLAQIATAQGQQHHSGHEHQGQGTEADQKTSVAAAFIDIHRLVAQSADLDAFLIGLRFGVQDDLAVVCIRLVCIGLSGGRGITGVRRLGRPAVSRAFSFEVGIVISLTIIERPGHQSLHEDIRASGFTISHWQHRPPN